MSSTAPVRDYRDAFACSRIPKAAGTSQTFADAEGGARGHSTAIYYLLEAGQCSHWHRVRDAAEVWHFYAGAPLALASAEDGKPANPDAWHRHPQRRTAAGDRSGQLVAIGSLARRMDARRLHGGARLRIFDIRNGAARLGTAGRLSYSAAAGAPRALARRSSSFAASTAPPVTNRQASAMRQRRLGKAERSQDKRRQHRCRIACDAEHLDIAVLDAEIPGIEGGTDRQQAEAGNGDPLEGRFRPDRRFEHRWQRNDRIEVARQKPVTTSVETVSKRRVSSE